MKSPLLFLSLFLALQCFSQKTIQTDQGNCGLHGSSRKGSKDYGLNVHKNRYDIPNGSDMAGWVTLKKMIKSADPNQFSEDSAVSITGYVFNVKEGSIETCNCKAKTAKYRDTHIEVTPDKDHTDIQYRVIVEVTPRLRAQMFRKGIDWSTTALKRSIKGHIITAKGWLLYDAEHEDQASANDPADAIGRKNFRATCWEIHPVTEIDVED